MGEQFYQVGAEFFGEILRAFAGFHRDDELVRNGFGLADGADALGGIVARTGALAWTAALSCGIAWASLTSSAGQASAPALTNAKAVHNSFMTAPSLGPKASQG